MDRSPHCNSLKQNKQTNKQREDRSSPAYLIFSESKPKPKRSKIPALLFSSVDWETLIRWISPTRSVLFCSVDSETQMAAQADEDAHALEMLTEEEEMLRFSNLGRKKVFSCLERLRGGKVVDVLQGLELHTDVFSAVEQKTIVDFVHHIQRKGRKGHFRDHTYSEPKKWMKGKGRVTIQFGCCYNYATDKQGNPPGILRHVVADPLPSLFKMMIRRLVRWHILPLSCIPDSCIVNIYEPGDCIPPHIDSHDFDRPFCTLSFLSECNILFESDLKVVAPGEFTGPVAVPLPVGSVLVLNGNGADVAKHCVPAVRAKRISITFRKMDERLHPYSFKPDVDLLNIEPFPYEHRDVSEGAVFSGGKRKHTVEERAIERVKEYLSSNREHNLYDRKVSKVRGSQRRDRERFDGAELDVSSRPVRRYVPVSDSPPDAAELERSSRKVRRRHHVVVSDSPHDAAELEGSSRKVRRRHHVAVSDSPPDAAELEGSSRKVRRIHHVAVSDSPPDVAELEGSSRKVRRRHHVAVSDYPHDAAELEGYSRKVRRRHHVAVSDSPRDAAELEGFSRKVRRRRHVAISDSPHILEPPSPRLVDAKKRRKLEAAIHRDAERAKFLEIYKSRSKNEGEPSS